MKRSTATFLISAALATALATGVVVFLCYPSWKLKYNSQNVHLGMTRSEVEGVLGKPAGSSIPLSGQSDAAVFFLKKQGWNGDFTKLTRSWWITRTIRNEFYGVTIVFENNNVVHIMEYPEE